MFSLKSTGTWLNFELPIKSFAQLSSRFLVLCKIKLQGSTPIFFAKGRLTVTTCCLMRNCVSWIQSRRNENHLIVQLCSELSYRCLINVALLRGARVMVLKVEVLQVEVFRLTPPQTNSEQLRHTLFLS